MIKRTSPTRENKPRQAARRPFRLLRAITQRIFARDDAFAREHGWQVTSYRGGFGRRYRDPRFDALAVRPRPPAFRQGGDGSDPCPPAPRGAAAG
ncbi:MAG TPA: hypothetical protein VE343_00290 [Streptosporangiaceae bacterium]|nr:hypothetical protein [Streptosporangiaceae bacterium]